MFASIVPALALAQAPAASTAPAPPATGSASSRGAPHRLVGPVALFPGFEMLPDGSSRVFVQLSKVVRVEERRTLGTFTYVLKGVQIPHPNNRHALVTVHFDTPVTRARLVPHGAEAHFVVEVRSPVVPTWKLTPQHDGMALLEVLFPPFKLPTETPAP
ncbi:MAG: hypothetical protein WCI05_05825 [Myxococcales bacterium]